MEVINEPIPGLIIIKPNVFEDERGFFLETWKHNSYSKIGINETFVQDNWSRSRKNVLRGLHYQMNQPQGKLVSVRRGIVFDVAVDIRKDSQTFGKWYGIELSDSNKLQMYIPPGVAHGFCVISDIADFVYKCTETYKHQDEGGILWKDEELGIDWPIRKPIISKKDSKLLLFSQLF